MTVQSAYCRKPPIPVTHCSRICNSLILEGRQNTSSAAWHTTHHCADSTSSSAAVPARPGGLQRAPPALLALLFDFRLNRPVRSAAAGSLAPVQCAAAEGLQVMPAPQAHLEAELFLLRTADPKGSAEERESGDCCYSIPCVRCTSLTRRAGAAGAAHHAPFSAPVPPKGRRGVGISFNHRATRSRLT